MGWMGVATDSASAQVTEPVATGGASQDAVGDADAELRQVAGGVGDVDVGDDGLAEASPAPSGGDAGRRNQVSNWRKENRSRGRSRVEVRKEGARRREV